MGFFVIFSSVPAMATQHQISKKRKFVADGVFYAELNEFLYRELSEDGFAGIEVRMTPTRTEVIIRATRTKNVLGEKGRRIRELTTLVQRRWGFKDGAIELYAARATECCASSWRMEPRVWRSRSPANFAPSVP